MNSPRPPLMSPRSTGRPRRKLTSRRRGSLRRLNSAPCLADDDEDPKPSSTLRRRASLNRRTTEDEAKNASDGNKAPAVLSAQVVVAEPIKIAEAVDEILKSPKKGNTKRRKQPQQLPPAALLVEEPPEQTPSSPIVSAKSNQITAASNVSSNPSSTALANKNNPFRPKYPRSILGMVVRIVKILHALLNIIVIRGSVLTRRNLNTKLDDYLATQQETTDTEDVVALFHQHIAHHLFVFYLSWGRLLICLMVLMWGTCTTRLPRSVPIYIGMAMHWVDSIRALDSNHWLPNISSEIPDPNRSLTAEEEVQTAMAWLHLFWFLTDGFYCRQIIKKRKEEEERIQHELYLELIGDDEAKDKKRGKKKRN